MNTERILLVICISAMITFSLRALPFLFFHGNKKMPEKLVYLGQILPSAIIAVLVIYCLRDAGSDWVHIGIPKLMAVGVVAISYRWKHNTLLSISVGTVCYMAMLSII